jgi:hypothetical protein
MKKFTAFVTFTLLIITRCYLVNAQDELYKIELPLNENQKIEFVDIVEVPNKTMADLYLLAKEWIAINYVSANDVIQMDEKEIGKIIVKGIFIHRNMGVDYKYHHTLKIETKDGKARITLGDLNLEYSAFGVTINQPARELIIDNLYGKNGKLNKGAKEQKEEIIKFWNKTKEGINSKFKSKIEDKW